MASANQKVAGGAVGLSAAALALAAVFIPHWEVGGAGLRPSDLVVKHQSFDPPNVYTVCAGITNLDDDFKWIRPGMKFTVQQCKDGFIKILPKYIEPIAKCIPTYYSMPAHRQIAVLSFGYNLGDGDICGDKHHSGAIAREFNAGHTSVACNLMGQYIRANGKVLQGLKNRRFDPKWGEISWCLRED